MSRVADIAAGWRAGRDRAVSPGERALVSAALAAAALVALPVVALALLATGGASALSSIYLTVVLPRAALDTLLLLAGVGAMTASVGVGAAWLASAFLFPGRALLSALLAAPLAIPTYIAAYIWVELLEPLGPVQRAIRAVFGFATPADYWFPPIRSLPGAILVFSLVLFPYVYLTARAVFMLQSASLLEVARTLGRGPAAIFWRVGLPLARPAVAAGMSLALLETLNDIGASEYLGVRTLTVTVMQTWLSRNSLPGAALIACAMLLIVGAVLIGERRMRRDRRFAVSVQKPRLAEPIRLSGARAWLVTGLCALPVLVAFVIPVGFLAYEAAQAVAARGLDPAFARQAMTTVTLAAVATLVVVALGAALVLAQRVAPSRATLAALRLSTLGYAVPGTVLAVGLLAPMTGLDRMISQTLAALAGAAPALWITGSGLGLVAAYAIRFLAISVGALESAASRFSPHLDFAARTLGRGPIALAREIHLPLLHPALGAAALLVFIDCLKELPATLILRPLNFDTLATALYEHATRGSFETGAPQALAIVLAGMIPVLTLARRNVVELDPDELARER
ncbi:MAG: iron ABC transporter permease [Rhizobiales bacterium]|nr:iron ABC transporter permease [Hyphomicrobiales bacterium]